MSSKLSFQSREIRPWPNDRFKRGTIVGHTTTHSAKIWLLAKKPGTYTLVLSETPLESPPGVRDQIDSYTLTETIEIARETCLTGVFRLGQEYTDSHPRLQADTQYYYGVNYEGKWILGVESQSNFKTLAESGILNFAFYSCHMPYKGRQLKDNVENWQNLRSVLERFHCDFLMGGGDQVYVDGTPDLDIIQYLKKHKDELLKLPQDERLEIMLSWYEDIYKGYWGNKDLQYLLSHTPTYMTWDDHEIMDGWGSFEADDLELLLRDGFWETQEERDGTRQVLYEMFQAASLAYFLFQHSHNPDTGIQFNHLLKSNTTPNRQWHYSFYAKNQAFFVMDTRGHKSIDVQDPHFSGKPSLLGQKQIEDLQTFLNHAATQEAHNLFITSAVPFVHWRQFIMDVAEVTNLKGTRDDVRDEWDHEINHPERDQVLDMIFEFAERHQKKVFILSGDVHCAASFQLEKRGTKAKVYQITSSAITYAKATSSWLVKKSVAQSGTLAGSDIAFQRLTPVETRNNFTLLSVEGEGPVCVDLYARAEQEEGVIMHERLRL